MAINAPPRMSVADYLEWKGLQELRHECIDGEIFEMSGGTLGHTRVKTKIGGELYARLDLSATALCNSDMRVRVSPARYVYPDFSVVRGEPRLEDRTELTLINPVLVFEVTSPSSQLRDRVEKRDYYFDALSVEACLIVDQERVQAELCLRAEAGWGSRVYDSPEAVISLPRLDCALPLSQVYQGIDFADA